MIKQQNLAIDRISVVNSIDVNWYLEILKPVIGTSITGESEHHRGFYKETAATYSHAKTQEASGSLARFS